MRPLDYIRSVRHVFATHRVRTVLTLLGIMIGSGSIVLLAGLLRGGEEALLETSQRANEADILQIRRDEPPSSQLHRTRRELSHSDAGFLSDSALLAGAIATSEQSRDGRAQWRAQKKRVRLVATTPVMQSLSRLHIFKGRFLTDDDLARRARVCVVGHTVWSELLTEQDDISDVHIQVLGERWTVVGVLEAKPPIGGSSSNNTFLWDNKVLVPRTTFDALYDPAHNASRLYVRLQGAGNLLEHMRAVETVVKQTLLRRHLGVENFKVEGEEGVANQFRLILDIIKLLLLGTGLLSLLVGGINIMNIMLVTVTERTREIGIRRAIGASPRTILLQFLIEAGVISSTGGVLGVSGGMFLCWLTARLLTRVLGNWNLHIETWSLGVGLALSLITGIVFGLLPARRASGLDPVEALRYE
jgi:putative ABC transport system permease protein